ncbi:UNVERIFIED_CONTAM: hypothetical protein GTU68_000968 [Idotea baltica]|nr:hypothetical protein [Idotea baltica]
MLGTLWPEISKLYGHGNELLSLASSHDGTLLASSCRATTDLDAKIILWNTKEWREHLALSYHRLSVTQIQFSDCDRFILSVSRDRSWAVFERGPENAFSLKFESGSLSKKSHHSRIIWSCAWVPRSLHFVTGSRDKTVAVWRPVCDGEGRVTSWDRGAVINVNEEVVAVAVERVAQEQKWLIAIGCANGSLLTKLFDDASNAVLESSEIEVPHRKSVRRLQFRPRADQSQSEFTLASSGNDNAVCLHQITL